MHVVARVHAAAVAARAPRRALALAGPEDTGGVGGAADAAAAAIEDVRRAVDTLTAVALDERAAASTTRGSSVDPGPSPVC